VGEEQRERGGAYQNVLFVDELRIGLLVVQDGCTQRGLGVDIREHEGRRSRIKEALFVCLFVCLLGGGEVGALRERRRFASRFEAIPP